MQPLCVNDEILVCIKIYVAIQARFFRFTSFVDIVCADKIFANSQISEVFTETNFVALIFYGI